jgi:serine/threonine protein kinase
MVQEALEGGYAVVYPGVMADYDGQVAIKIIRPSIIKNSGLENVRRRLCREIAVWLRLRHPNIVGLLGIAHDLGPLPALVSPWIDGQDAMTYLTEHPSADRMKIILGVASVLDYMHQQDPPIVHGDLKGSNVLISDAGDALLCDFGLARVLRQVGMTTGFTTDYITGTPMFMAAELHHDPPQPPTTATDVYAFGGTCLQILTGQLPFCSSTHAILSIYNGQKPMRPANFPNDALWDLLSQCWEHNPQDRPSMFEITSKLRNILLSNEPVHQEL